MVNNKIDVAIIDRITQPQLEINGAECEHERLLRIPAGRHLYDWCHYVQSRWWYKLFSRFDRELGASDV